MSAKCHILFRYQCVNNLVCVIMCNHTGVLYVSASYLTHCGLLMPYDIELGQHWFRQWIVAWWHQVITWTNANYQWSLVAFTWGKYHKKYPRYEFEWQEFASSRRQWVDTILRWSFQRGCTVLLLGAVFKQVFRRHLESCSTDHFCFFSIEMKMCSCPFLCNMTINKWVSARKT